MYSPDKDGLKAVVGINSNGNYERQRFTAAHELCHHLRDYLMPSVSKSGDDNDGIERYANRFASELLMPRRYFLNEARRYQDERGFVHPDNALYLCNIFGTSFTSVMWSLQANRLLEFTLTNDFFTTYPIRLRSQALDIKKLDYVYLKNIVDNYTYIYQKDTSPLWFRLKNELIYHDGKIEGLVIEKEIVAEICTDLRLYGNNSPYYTEYSDNPTIVETVGQYYLYDILQKKETTPDQYELIALNKTLFLLAPNKDEIKDYRESNNSISGAVIRTTHYQQIPEFMLILSQDIQYYCSQLDKFSFSTVIEHASSLHHRLTKIHPFEDGNGRVSRALLNWILKLKELPPIYVEANQKEKYLDALKAADNGIYEELNQFFLERTLHSLIFLNSELLCSDTSLYEISKFDQSILTNTN
nr:Fic family protein [Bacillus toyonensis]